MQARDWDGASYDRISAPQEALGRAVLARMHLRGDETVLDAGCGSGRVTEALLERLPRGRVIAVDASPSMVEQARRRLGARRVEIHQMDLLELELDAAGGRDPLDRDLPLGARPRRPVSPPARRAAPRRPARRPVRGRGQHRPPARDRERRADPRAIRRALPRLAHALVLRGPRAHARAPARGRLHRGGVLACSRRRSTPSSRASSSPR